MDKASGLDRLSVVKFPGPLLIDHKKVVGRWSIEKFDAPIEWYLAKVVGLSLADIELLGGWGAPLWSPRQRMAADAMMRLDKKPFGISETEENLLLNAGITSFLNNAIANPGADNSGASPANANAKFNNAQSRIGVGDSTTAEAASQTDLQASTNKLFKAMDATFPSVASQTVSWRSTYGTGDANFAWQEFVIDNCQGSNATSTTRSGGATLCRKVSNQGTKASGQTWVPTYNLTLS